MLSTKKLCAVIALTLLQPSLSCAGEASNPAVALSIVADKIETGDLKGVRHYFRRSQKNDQVLAALAHNPKAQRKTVAAIFRTARLKGKINPKNYKNAKPGEAYFLFTSTVQFGGKPAVSEIIMCGSAQRSDWYVCSW